MKQSAGFLLYRLNDNNLEVMLVHPGGPFYSKRDKGVWSIPKGEFLEPETALHAANREFEEELGHEVPSYSRLIKLGEAKQGSTKTNHIWAIEHDFDTTNISSNTFKTEWPPKSGTTSEFPEIDRAEWFLATTAKAKLWPAQVIFIERLEEKLGLHISLVPKSGQTSLDF